MHRLLILLLLTACCVQAAEDPLDPSGAPAAVRRDLFRAAAAHDAGDPDAAVRILSDALSDDRDHPLLRHRLAGHLLELGRPDEALEHLRRAVGLIPDSAILQRDLARAAYETGEYVHAAEAFARSHALAPEPTLLYYAGVSWSLAERYVEASETLASLIEGSTEAPPLEWTRALVSAAALSGRPERADAAVERLLRDHPDDPESWTLAGQHSQLRDDLPAAAARLQVAHWLEPLASDALRRLGDLYDAAGLPRLAARVYAQLRQEDPRLVRPLATAWLRAHEPDSARSVLTAVVESRADAGLWLLLGDLEYDEERWSAARVAYARASALEPDAGRSWLMQGACSVQLGDPDGARAALDRALDHPESAAQAARYLAALESAPALR